VEDFPTFDLTFAVEFADTGCPRCAKVLSQSLLQASQTLREFPQNPPKNSNEKWENIPQSMLKNSFGKTKI
jgi:hypothetical protein